ncbi:hypothetical protein J2W88_000376 [Acidovorax delafieldii]|uniref:Uncharacterized protein n=1 Tax=Acidovorax delafieldii TaxID=47920 RepID=A0AAJ2BS17_ACIDE|nr:hypothetical protein [Acidovorax delafieldii]MDR6835556.1 hypothetical protein [Acidovorax delafieldii]MDR7365474.1 hypothetical protein [Acidovorax delafieldii]
MRRARERNSTPLWITLGTFLAQPGSYPHKTPPPESCCRRAPHLARAAPHTLQRRKCASTLKKKRLSTQTGVLYYYCYLYIKPLKNNQNPQSGHLSTAGDRSIGRLDNLTDRRLMPEWGSNGSACAVLSGESLTPLEAAKRSCWWGAMLPPPGAPHSPSARGDGAVPPASPEPLQPRRRSMVSTHLLSINEHSGQEAVALPFVLGPFPATDARGA